MRYCHFLLLFPLLSVSRPAFSGDNHRTVVAVRTPTSPVIDGILDEPVWRLAVPATDFIQRDPEEGASATERTEIRVLYDDRAIYFGCMFYDSYPPGIVARLTRRDDEVESDWGSIRIDSFHDQQTAFEFTFNPAGVRVDILEFGDGDHEDESWNPVWDLETSIAPDGWRAEISIPFSELRYRSADGDTSEQEWGINFIRTIMRKNESDRWAFSPKSESGFVSRFGHLRGLRDLPVPSALEILPFVLAKQQWDPSSAAVEQRRFHSASAGLDLKYGISNSLTLDATVNPDFGQVEADPAVLNLTTFETFYPEKRPFFVEGTQILRFSTFGDDAGPGLFYSRRIGRAISIDEADVPAGGTLQSVPQTVSILGAAKITGRVTRDLSIGVLQAVTGREYATVSDSTGVTVRQILEPLADYGVVRLRQDVLEGSNLGLIFTSVAKESRLPAFTGGADWMLKFDNNSYRLDGFVSGSYTTDEEDEKISGSAGRLSFGRIGAEHWLWNLSGDFTTRDYNINDIGYFRRPNDFGSILSVTYKDDLPRDIYRSYHVGVSAHERWNFDRANLYRQIEMDGEILLPNYWFAEVSGSLDAGLYDDRETRGNGLYAKPRSYTAGAFLGTDERLPVSLGLSGHLGWDVHGKHQLEAQIGLELKPISWMQWEIETVFGWTRGQEAWVENIGESDGTVSIFADRSTDETDVILRGTVTFTRDLTLQLYSQLFLAKGHYEGFRRLSGTSEFVPYPFTSNPDFNEQSFHLNVVLRWEYLPGSTLYFVWSQARSGELDSYFTGFSDEFRNTFRVPASNVLILKVSYWWNAG